MFQPRSGTAPSLGSVAKVTSHLNPAPSFNCFRDIFLSPSLAFLPPPYATLRLSCTAIFTPDCPPFSSCLQAPVHMDKHPLPPASTACPCARCLAALDLLPRSLSAPADPRRKPVSASPPRLFAPLSLPSTSIASLTTPVGAPF